MANYAHLLKTGVLCLLSFVLLSQCRDPRTRLQFSTEGKKSQELIHEFAEELEIRIRGNGVLVGNRWLVSLCISLRGADSLSLKWDPSRVHAVYRGVVMSKRIEDHYPLFVSRNRAEITVDFSGKVDFSFLWAGEERRPVEQDIAIVLDSSIELNGRPLALDTIRASCTPPPHP